MVIPVLQPEAPVAPPNIYRLFTVCRWREVLFDVTLLAMRMNVGRLALPVLLLCASASRAAPPIDGVFSALWVLPILLIGAVGRSRLSDRLDSKTRR